MQITPKYRKTVGALVMVGAFVLQWVSTEYENFSEEKDVSGYFAEIKELQYQMLYYQTHDVTYLGEALKTQAVRLLFFSLRPEFSPETSEDRAKAIFEAEQHQPKSLEDYIAVRDSLNKKIGSYLPKEYWPAALKMATIRSILKYCTFALSLFGLLLIWTGDAFDKKAWRLNFKGRDEALEDIDRD